MSGYRGVKNRFAKLIDADVLAMRTLHEQGWSLHFLSRIFQVSRTHTKRIVRGEKWAWLK
jgi:hypothetical protein